MKLIYGQAGEGGYTGQVTVQRHFSAWQGDCSLFSLFKGNMLQLRMT